MIVYIDRQHAGKPNKIDDRGAGADIDGNGTKDTRNGSTLDRLPCVDVGIQTDDDGVSCDADQ